MNLLHRFRAFPALSEVFRQAHGYPESSIFKAVSEKVQKQGMHCRRRILKPRFTFELRPLLEHFWRPDVNITYF